MSTRYLDDLPKDVATQLALNRIVSTAEAASLCNCSIRHWRQLYKEKKVPPPVRLSARKFGWRLGTLVDFNAGRVAS